MEELKEYGNDVTTTIVYSSVYKKKLNKVAMYYSKLWDVKNNSAFANLIEENGIGNEKNNKDWSVYEVNYDPDTMYEPTAVGGRVAMRKVSTPTIKKEDALNNLPTISIEDYDNIDEKTPLDNVVNKENNVTLSYLLTKYLTPREERVIRMRFGIGVNTDHTLEEVGRVFSVTGNRIRDIEGKALRKLKHPSRGLNELLELEAA